jgi:hypothetical protein
MFWMRSCGSLLDINAFVITLGEEGLHFLSFLMVFSVEIIAGPRQVK